MASTSDGSARGKSERRVGSDDPAATYAELVEQLQARWADMSRSHRTIAERVLSDPEGVAFMTVSELASVAEVNESTVVRFASGLGLDGYPALVRLCRERLREQAQLLRRFENATGLPDDGDTRSRTAAFDQINVVRTFSRITPESWDQAVETLATADTVHVLGLRKCHAPAFLLGYLLSLVRDEVRTLTLGAGMLADELRRVREGDAFVAMSIHRYTADTVNAFRLAAKRGAKTIAMTDSPASPLARHEGPTFYVDTAGASVLRSVTAFTSIAQALSADVSARLGATARSALRTEEDLLQEFGTYTESP